MSYHALKEVDNEFISRKLAEDVQRITVSKHKLYHYKHCFDLFLKLNNSILIVKGFYIYLLLKHFSVQLPYEFVCSFRFFLDSTHHG